MAAHLRPIHIATCAWCGGRASVVLHNTHNVEIGSYCGRHGDAKLRDFIKQYPDEGPYYPPEKRSK